MIEICSFYIEGYSFFIKNCWIDEGNDSAPCNQRRWINVLPFTLSYFIIGHRDFVWLYDIESMKLSVCRVPLADHKMHRQSVNTIDSFSKILRECVCVWNFFHQLLVTSHYKKLHQQNVIFKFKSIMHFLVLYLVISSISFFSSHIDIARSFFVRLDFSFWCIAYVN